MTTAYSDYTTALQTLFEVPGSLAADRAQAEAEAARAREIASSSPQEARRLLDYTTTQAHTYLTDARDLMRAVGLETLIPLSVKAARINGAPAKTDVAHAEQQVRNAYESLRLAVLAHREGERSEAEARRLAAEAELERKRQEELAREEEARRRARATARRRKRNRLLVALGAVLILVLTVLILL